MSASQLNSKVVWLTGASSGIGAALIGPLLDQGCRLAITARRGELLSELARPFAAAGKPVLVCPADASDRDAVRTAHQAIVAAWGPVDVAIFNAGASIPVQVRRFDSSTFEAVWRTNVMSVVYGIEAVLPAMIERRSGYIVGVASVAGYRGLPTAPAYGASKAALINMLESLRFDLEPFGVDVTIVNPGFVRTPMTDKNKFPMPFLLETDDAARRIVAGLCRRRREIHFPRRFTWLLKALRILPYPIYHAIVRRVSRS